jgi:hypothetical protein
MFLEVDRKLVCSGAELFVIVLRLKSVEECAFLRLGIKPMSHISVALMAQYLNVRQRKLGTIIIQTVHIRQHNRADTGSVPVEDLSQSKLLPNNPARP